MGTPVLPSTARRLVTVLVGPCALVGTRGGTTAHLYAWTTRTGRPTTTGRLRRGTGPVCGQRGRGWRTVDVTAARPLCRRCTGWLHRHPAIEHPERAATVDDVQLHLTYARTFADVDACQSALIHSGLAAAMLPGRRGAEGLLTGLVRRARSRIAAAERRREHEGLLGRALGVSA